MQQDNTQKRKMIAVIVIAAFLLSVVVILLSMPPKNEAASEQTNDAAPQAAEPAVQYNGFTDLSKRGLTSYQMEGVKYALFNYASNASNFTIDASTIQQSPYDRDNPTPTVQINFAISIDKKSYTAKVDKYTDLVTVRVYLYEQGASQPVYDSQPIDSRQLQNQQGD